jgi:uncharacterized protein
MIRAVLDTNVLVSAEIKKEGKPNQILRQVDKFEWLTSEYILGELARVLLRKHIQTKYHKQATAQERSRYEGLIRSEATLVAVTTEASGVPRDVKDNPVLACAKDGQATHIVTGDRHLLQLDAYEGIQIVTPEQFLHILENERSAESPSKD